MQRIEIECDDVAAADRRVEYRGAANQGGFPPDLSAYQDGRAAAIAPFEYDAAGVKGAIKAGRAIGHAQPATWNGIERKILAENMRMSVIAVCDGMLRPRERHAQVRARCARDGFLG